MQAGAEGSLAYTFSCVETETMVSTQVSVIFL